MTPTTSIDRKLLIREMSWEELIMLRMYSGQTYSFSIDRRSLRESMESKGLLKWVPGTAWAGNNNYELTDYGKKVRNALSNLSDDERRALRPRTDTQGQRATRPFGRGL